MKNRIDTIKDREKEVKRETREERIRIFHGIYYRPQKPALEEAKTVTPTPPPSPRKPTQ